MKARRGATRIETRTWWLFVACALVPVAAFALLGFVVVSGELQRLAQERLDAAAKGYGLVILDRLQQIDGDLTQRAQLHLQTAEPDPPASITTDRAVFRVLDISRTASAASRNPHINKTLHTIRRGDATAAVVEVSVRNPQGSIRMQAEVMPDYLWNDEAVLLPGATPCVLTEEVALRCADDNDVPAHATSDQLTSEWTLFLNASYGAPAWRIRVQQPRSDALGALNAFRWMLPATAMLAVTLALLFGSIFIRRSHAPLHLLTQAARRVARRDFSQPVVCESRDEYGRLTRTFNRMAGNLQNQFALQTGFARIDEIILSRAGAAEAIDSLLPQMPHMLGCNVAGVLLMESSGRIHVRLATQTGERRDDTLEVSAELMMRQGMRRLTRDAAPALFALAGIANGDLVLCAITVAGVIRGHVAASDERFGRAATQGLLGIAQRLAVAIGNDDAQQALWRQAHLDPLTGLANRLLLQRRITQAIDDARADNSHGAVIFLDLDRFKSVNDSLGHSSGDVLLRRIAERLTTHAPRNATVARFGGDEFVILLPHADEREAKEHAQRILESLADPCMLDEIHYVTHASAGIALFPHHGTDADALLKHADIAMYRAKSAGRGTACLFDASMSEDIAVRLQLEQQLRDALRNGEIRAHFQPKVDASGAMVAAEALARWQDSRGAFISPALFIPVAEDTGLVTVLGESMVIQACRQLRQWRSIGLTIQHVAVNISMLQLRDPAFAPFVERTLALFGLPGDSLELEVTESLFAQDGQEAVEQLRRLARGGVRIAIDDFGTGFSSMSRLREFPITTLKIDQSFVRDCVRSDKARMLLKALIDVGHALHLEVVAEGVETAEQRDTLRTLGCGLMQGFLFTPALPAEEATRLLVAASVRPVSLQEAG